VDPSQATADRRHLNSILRRCRPVEPGSVAAKYLSGRGCALPPAGSDLLVCADLVHPSGHSGPALVAVVTNASTNKIQTLHMTWLAADGSGKALVDRPRLLLRGHPKRGGVVRLWPEDEITTGLAVAEGIESALSLARAFGAAWACLYGGNLAALPVLGGVEALTIAADHDVAGLRAAGACAARWRAAGAEVRIWTAPVAGDDFNDYAVRHAGGAA
jgi:putative DNA primase/helicase